VDFGSIKAAVSVTWEPETKAFSYGSRKRKCLPHFISTGYNSKRGGNYRLNQIENDGNMVKADGKSELDELIDSLTLFDDDLMTLVFDGNIGATELLLSIILAQEVKVISVRAQVELRSPYKKGRKIRVDILARDIDGKRFNVEVQAENSGADCRRARYHSSMVDVNMLKSGKDYKKLRDSYVIFITKNDYFKRELPLYRVERSVCETGERFCDGSHIIYVNGSYKGDDAIGRLVHDFRCSNAEDMYYSQFADGVRYYKESGGKEKMCEKVERYAEKKAEERARTVKEYAEKKAAERAAEKIREAEETAEKRATERVRQAQETAEKKAQASKAAMVRSLMENMHFTIEQAFDVLNVSEDDRKFIAENI
jgi:predicted transposase/invertase (TIGR01784 family)